MRAIFGFNFIVITALIGCGDASFRGFSPLPDSAEKERNDSADASPEKDPGVINGDETVSAALLNWEWPCAVPNRAPVLNEQGEVVVFGEGPHQIQILGDDLSLKLQLEVCADAASLARDIVFVVDMSSSMVDNDPLINGRCGRMDAIEAVLASANQHGLARAGLVTFDSKALTLTAMMEVDQLLNQYVTANNLCKSRFSGSTTHYHKGLEQVAGIFSSGRASVGNEVYFISDGKPKAGSEGISEAQSLRADGVTIGTLMLKGDDAILKQQIASKDIHGQPLHAKISQAADLADTLTGLSEAFIPTSGYVRWKPGSNDQWEEQDLFEDGSVDLFHMNIDQITGVTFPGGLDFEFRYEDDLGRSKEGAGTLQWQTSP